MTRKTFFVSIDYDGCMTMPGRIPTEFPVEIIGLFNNIFSENSNAEIVILIGSLRQTIQIDESNAQHNRNGSCFATFLACLNAYHRRYPLRKDQIKLDAFLFADVINGNRAGTHFNEVMDRAATSLEINDPQSAYLLDERGKRDILYAQFQYVGKTYPGEKIFYFFDDREEILKESIAFFRGYPQLIPASILFKPRQHDAKLGYIDFIKSVIKGTGILDSNYQKSAKLLIQEEKKKREKKGDILVQYLNLTPDFQISRLYGFIETITVSLYDQKTKTNCYTQFLFDAIRLKNIELIGKLVSYGVDITQRETSYKRPLEIALFQELEDAEWPITLELIRLCKFVSKENDEDAAGFTAVLFYAVYKKRFDIALELLSKIPMHAHLSDMPDYLFTLHAFSNVPRARSILYWTLHHQEYHFLKKLLLGKTVEQAFGRHNPLKWVPDDPEANTILTQFVEDNITRFYYLEMSTKGNISAINVALKKRFPRHLELVDKLILSLCADAEKIRNDIVSKISWHLSLYHTTMDKACWLAYHALLSEIYISLPHTTKLTQEIIHRWCVKYTGIFTLEHNIRTTSSCGFFACVSDEKNKECNLHTTFIEKYLLDKTDVAQDSAAPRNPLALPPFTH